MFFEDLKYLLFLLLVAAIVFFQNIFVVYSTSLYGQRMLHVRNEPMFSTIQEAINNARDGDVINIPSGFYRERVVVNKSIILRGENLATTIIDGGGEATVIYVVANNSEISGFTVQNGLHGFYVDSCHAKIHSNIVKKNSYGIFLSNSRFNEVYRNNFTEDIMPIVMQNSSSNFIAENFIYYNFGQAISVYNSNNNSIMNNRIEKNPAFGIYFERSMNNTIGGNEVANVCQGIHLNVSKHNLVLANIIKNTGPYAIFLSSSERNRVCKNFLSDNEIALELSHSCSNIIEENNITLSKLGLLLTCSSSNILRKNNVANSWAFGNFGIYGYKLEHFINDVDDTNTVDGKPIYFLINKHNVKFSENAGYVAIVNSSNVIVENLNLQNNYQALTIAYTVNITLSNLQIENNFQGFYMIQSSGNVIKGCTFKGNYYNFYFNNSSFNYIFHNNFFGNRILDSAHSHNIWDNGYPYGGNYWSELQPHDNFMGAYQNITGFDGVCDTPKILYGQNVDRYPLIAPVKIFTTVFAEEFTAVSNSTISNFSFKPEEGPYIHFDVNGPLGTVGFCRISIPKKLLWVNNSDWEILLDNHNITYTKVEDERNVYLSFYYDHALECEIKICGTDAIVEYSSFTLLLAAILISAFTFTLVAKKVHGRCIR